MDRLVRLGLFVSIAAMSTVRAASYDGFIRTANVGEHVEDVRINIEDRHTVNVVTSFVRSDPSGTVHTLKVEGDLSLRATTHDANGFQYIRVDVIRSKGGEPLVLAYQNWMTLQGQSSALNFSVCGERMIAISGGTKPGRCADLLPMTKPDPMMGDCDVSCAAPYEGMPAEITSRARIAPLSEPGEPLTISGHVTGPDGRPRAGIIVYAYHTDRLGIYPPPVPPRSTASDNNGRLRGWARTDAEGHYVFGTIRPGSYPHTNNPQHVHMHVIEPGCGTYYIKELQFSDDPVRARLTEEERKHQEDAAIETPRKTAKGWEVTRDIRLGENVKGYKPCSATK